MLCRSLSPVGEKLKLDVPVLVKGGVKVEEGSNTKILVGDITPLEQATPRLPRSLRIKIPLEGVSENTVSGPSRPVSGA